MDSPEELIIKNKKILQKTGMTEIEILNHLLRLSTSEYLKYKEKYEKIKNGI